jgi:hypothetical protein
MLSKPLLPGYGLRTLLWWQKFEPKLLESAVSCGTIMDFFIAIVTKNVKQEMSPHNAHSFGGWSRENGWEIDSNLLPKVVEIDQIFKGTN